MLHRMESVIHVEASGEILWSVRMCSLGLRVRNRVSSNVPINSWPVWVAFFVTWALLGIMWPDIHPRFTVYQGISHLWQVWHKTPLYNRYNVMALDFPYVFSKAKTSLISKCVWLNKNILRHLTFFQLTPQTRKTSSLELNEPSKVC